MDGPIVLSGVSFGPSDPTVVVAVSYMSLTSGHASGNSFCCPIAIADLVPMKSFLISCMLHEVRVKVYTLVFSPLNAVQI